MRIRPRFLLAAVALVAGLTTGVYGRADVNDAPLQYQIGTLLFDETRYREAIEAFRKALNTDNKSLQIQARMGVIKTALRLGEFLEAQKEGATLKQQDPKSADVIAIDRKSTRLNSSHT